MIKKEDFTCVIACNFMRRHTFKLSMPELPDNIFIYAVLFSHHTWILIVFATTTVLNANELTIYMNSNSNIMICLDKKFTHCMQAKCFSTLSQWNTIWIMWIYWMNSWVFSTIHRILFGMTLLNIKLLRILKPPTPASFFKKLAPP